MSAHFCFARFRKVCSRCAKSVKKVSKKGSFLGVKKGQKSHFGGCCLPSPRHPDAKRGELRLPILQKKGGLNRKKGVDIEQNGGFGGSKKGHFWVKKGGLRGVMSRF